MEGILALGRHIWFSSLKMYRIQDNLGRMPGPFAFLASEMHQDSRSGSRHGLEHLVSGNPMHEQSTLLGFCGYHTCFGHDMSYHDFPTESSQHAISLHGKIP
jgi:hypothetical protein